MTVSETEIARLTCAGPEGVLEADVVISALRGKET